MEKSLPKNSLMRKLSIWRSKCNGLTF